MLRFRLMIGLIKAVKTVRWNCNLKLSRRKGLTSQTRTSARTPETRMLLCCANESETNLLACAIPPRKPCMQYDDAYALGHIPHTHSNCMYMRLLCMECLISRQRSV